MDMFLLTVADEVSVGDQSIISASRSAVLSSSIRSFARPKADDDGLEKVGESRDGRPKIGFKATVAAGVDDNESVARRSGSVACRGAGDERELVGEGVNVGWDVSL